ncbi:hypothetical protein TIFTF001_029147 [Ficus carica]|uniref:Uncharacterized protein n=1 Tax=Ficus carica TaxID=3494 RepID=A0AA88DR94_FICCA|nr:hypothetical protein TIFTF001_029147 [Ficus carica]
MEHASWWSRLQPMLRVDADEISHPRSRGEVQFSHHRSCQKGRENGKKETERRGAIIKSQSEGHKLDNKLSPIPPNPIREHPYVKPLKMLPPGSRKKKEERKERIAKQALGQGISDMPYRQ